MPSRAAAVRRRWPDLRPNPSLLRAWLDLSQAEMAAALGVSVNTWLVQTLSRVLAPRHSGRGRPNRLTGYGRS